MFEYNALVVDITLVKLWNCKGKESQIRVILCIEWHTPVGIDDEMELFQKQR